MNPALTSMLERYQCRTATDYQNALNEILQELALLGLWRGKFFEHAAFYGGTALRIIYGLDRFSEDLDFSLLKPDPDFRLKRYLDSVECELRGMGFNATVEAKEKTADSAIESAFIKANTREHLVRIQVPESLSGKIQRTKLLKVKLEVDTDPPPGFQTEAKTLLQPIPFSVRTYQPPDLFAGKIHAVLQRSWGSGRVKGRDYYDFVWYIGRQTPVRLAHLEQRLRQSGGWPSPRPLQTPDLIELLKSRFRSLDVDAARRDVLPFLRDEQSTALWSGDFFESLLSRLTTC